MSGDGSPALVTAFFGPTLGLLNDESRNSLKGLRNNFWTQTNGQTEPLNRKGRPLPSPTFREAGPPGASHRCCSNIKVGKNSSKRTEDPKKLDRSERLQVTLRMITVV